jgi:hypothetical protein
VANEAIACNRYDVVQFAVDVWGATCEPNDVMFYLTDSSLVTLMGSVVEQNASLFISHSLLAPAGCDS